jgi:hypothetical protein
MAKKFEGEELMQEILDKDPQVVTEEERDILRARKSYLTREQIANFGLEVKEEVAPVATDNVEDGTGKVGKAGAGTGTGKVGKAGK